MGQSGIRGRSAHEKSLFHMAERIPLKEPSEHAEPYPWRTPVPNEELEAVSAMITKYDLMLIEFTSDGTNWTILQRSKH